MAGAERGLFSLEFNQEQFVAWSELNQAIDDAPSVVPCTNDPDLFYGDDRHGLNTREAKLLCSSCPVIKECFAYAVKWEDEGVWGGTGARERQNLKSRFSAGAGRA